MAQSPVEDRLNALRDCLPAQYKPAIDTLSKGLLYNWKANGVRVAPPPPEYIASLDAEINACRAAAPKEKPRYEASAKTPAAADKRETNGDFAAIARDLEIKTADCRSFGMGRLVPVEVKTVLNGAPSNGWQVFYRWAGSSVFAGREIPFASLTSPARASLPPGIYLIRVQKQGQPTLAKAPDPITLVVGRAEVSRLEIPVQ
ncbi:MAG TPA: hypothetical protein VL346_12060 [Acidobacteriaceae bacterium]|nr:hypothetical protein [Acidobacteriaceae bacterium]